MLRSNGVNAGKPPVALIFFEEPLTPRFNPPFPDSAWILPVNSTIMQRS
jgi:hypothetical protein